MAGSRVTSQNENLWHQCFVTNEKAEVFHLFQILEKSNQETLDVIPMSLEAQPMGHQTLAAAGSPSHRWTCPGYKIEGTILNA